MTEGKRTSWGVFGDDDVLGCLNLLTAERAIRAAGLVQRGAVFPLDAPLDVLDPPLFGRQALRHQLFAFPSGNAFDDHVTAWNTQASSQWDGLRHIRDPALGFYNRREPAELGIDRWAARGIVGRGVLADVGRWRAAEGRPVVLGARDEITADDLTATLVRQGVQSEPGDILLVRTGWLGWYTCADPAIRTAVDPLTGLPGLAASREMAETLWNLHIAAVAADNPGLEAFPQLTSEDPEHGHLHWDLLPRLGIPIGELWSLDGLAADCEADGRYDFLVTSAPLHLPGGVASPPNALAVK